MATIDEEAAERRYCPCNGECHVGRYPCSFDCFGHHDEILTSPGLFGRSEA